MTDDQPFSATDENQAPLVPSDHTPACFHCPNTNCDGHYYLTARDFGRRLRCSKCGLMVTIGTSDSDRLFYFAALLIGAVLGFLVPCNFVKEDSGGIQGPPSSLPTILLPFVCMIQRVFSRPN